MAVPRFAYKAMDNQGNERFDILEADNEADAASELGRQGLLVTSLHRANVADELRLKWRVQKHQREAEKNRKHEATRAKRPRQRLVVRFRDGRTLYGVCFALNPSESKFHLNKVDNGGTLGESEEVRFRDLKAVFHVKSFDGKFNPAERHEPMVETVHEMVVEFEDGEVIRGYTQRHYDPDDERFYLVPADTATSNNISILVERSAVKGVLTPEEYEAKKAEQREERKKQPTGADLTQEETTGDFYFETKNYHAALQQYDAALRLRPQLPRLRKKVIVCRYNIGVEHIKRREYGEALGLMEQVLKADPNNQHAKKKVHQLRKILERSGRH